MGVIKYGRGDIAELGKRVGERAHAERERLSKRDKPTYAYDGKDVIACVLYVTGSIVDGNSVYTLETLGELPHGIPALSASAPSQKRAEWRLRWAFAGALMDRRRRVYVGAGASEKARARAKAAELYIAEAPREGQT